MNNPDDQSVPSVPNSIPIVINSDTTNNALVSPPNGIPLVISSDATNNPSLPPSNPIPLVIAPGKATPTPPPSPPIQVERVLVAQNLWKYAVNGMLELRDVSFQLLKGQLTCIIGREEDGVSSLFRVLALEEPVAQGQLTILNTPVSQLPMEECERWRSTRIAYIRQGHLGLAEQTGRMLVAYWLHYYNDLRWDKAKEVARQALKEVGVTHHRADIALRDLSIAEVARVSIAKAYVRSQHCIYLFDDLFAALDQNAAQELVQLLHAVVKQGKAVVVQANRQDILSDFDQVLEMQDGEIQVYQHP